MTAKDGGGDEAFRDRIIAHMNQLHSRELTHYLRHYRGLTTRQSAGATLHDLTLQGMRIRARGIDHVVNFNPPLQSWTQVRQRVVEMDAVARDGLGISDIYMDRFYMPDLLGSLVMIGVGSYFISALCLPWIKPGLFLWGLLDMHFPWGAETFRWLVKMIFLPVLGIHILEPLYFDMSRLRKHGVDRGSGLWWMWIVSCFLEGFTAFKRFDRVIASRKAEKEAKKH
ncbi:hypothetical protein E4U28_006437 [Claviceps purpurea]|nr:hypothetical protein E4U28_006437 [Claviceps purpurea]